MGLMGFGMLCAFAFVTSRLSEQDIITPGGGTAARWDGWLLGRFENLSQIYIIAGTTR